MKRWIINFIIVSFLKTYHFPKQFMLRDLQLEFRIYKASVKIHYWRISLMWKIMKMPIADWLSYLPSFYINLAFGLRNCEEIRQWIPAISEIILFERIFQSIQLSCGIAFPLSNWFLNLFIQDCFHSLISWPLIDLFANWSQFLNNSEI